jgi:GT2 family glycosyltransferase
MRNLAGLGCPTSASSAVSPQAKEEVPIRRPIVLVGIVTRNRASILPKAIQSALSQAYPLLEIAVLDDGSEDETPCLEFSFPQIEWTRWESPRGYLEARNHLMRNTQADFYLSLDDDAWFVKGDEIAAAVDHLEAHPTVAAVAFDILDPDHPKAVSRSAYRPTHMFIGCGHVVRLSAVREAGYYVPGPGLYGSEEKDLCLRLLDRNWEVHLLPGTHVWHDRTSVARNLPDQHRSGVCNDLAFALRRCPFPLILGVLPVKLLNHISFAVGHRLLKSCVGGISLFFRHSSPVWGSREPVRAATFTEFMRRSREVL